MRIGTPKFLIYTVSGIILFWVLITFYVQYHHKTSKIEVGSANARYRALIVYHPDAIYNFDEQVCRAIANGLEESGVSALITTTDNAEPISEYDLLILCANTYNWAPDWQISKYIKNLPELNEKPCVAITLGAGSTQRAQKIHEGNIDAKQGKLLLSQSYWLLRPNDENQTGKDNIAMALMKAAKLGREVGKLIASKRLE